MARIAALACYLPAIAQRLAGAKRWVMALGRRRPSTPATMDERLLHDIGLSRHDLWNAASESIFRATPGFTASLGLGHRASGEPRIGRGAGRD